MYETEDEIRALQDTLDRSAAAAGPHLSGILTPARRLRAEELAERLQGMVLLTVATATADGRPLAGPVDGYLLHGSFHFSSGRHAVRVRHLRSRPHCSATHVPDESLAVTVHGRASLYDVNDPARPDLRRAMVAHSEPRQGPAFERWLDEVDPVGVRIEAAKLFTFSVS